MFIAIEGADGSGKSLLIEAVKAEISSRYPNEPIHEFHQGRPLEESRQWVLSEYAISIEEIVWSGSVHGIADRWHWGEVTYAPLKRVHTCKDDFGLLGVAGWRWVELFMASRGMAQFWLYQPLDVITRRLAARGDDFVKPSELEQILGLYENAADSVWNLAGKVFPGADSLESNGALAKTIVSAAEQRATSVQHLAKFPDYIGGPRPSVLLVGDRRNGPTDTILPFKPINSNSGEYLMSALPETFWREIGIVNSADVYGMRAHQLLHVLGNPPIVALGRCAENELRNSGFNTLQYTVVPHPQYVRRFHHQDRFEYGRAIQRLATTRGKESDPWILP